MAQSGSARDDFECCSYLCILAQKAFSWNCRNIEPDFACFVAARLLTELKKTQ